MSEGPISSFLSRRLGAGGQEKTDSPKDTSTVSLPRQSPDAQQVANELLVRSGLPPLSDEETVVDKLVEAMDMAALRFLLLLEDDSRDEDNNLLVDFRTRADTFKMVREWVVSRDRVTDGDKDANPGKGFEAYKKTPTMPEKDANGKFISSAPKFNPDGTPRPPPKSHKKGAGKKAAVNQLKPNTPQGAETLMERMKRLQPDLIEGN